MDVNDVRLRNRGQDKRVHRIDAKTPEVYPVPHRDRRQRSIFGVPG